MQNLNPMTLRIAVFAVHQLHAHRCTNTAPGCTCPIANAWQDLVAAQPLEPTLCDAADNLIIGHGFSIGDARKPLSNEVR